MKKIIQWGFMALLAVTLSLGGCKKSEEADTDITSAEDQSQSEMVFDQIFKQVDDAANEEGLGKGGFPIITIDTTVIPRTMTIDYGNSNYLCKDGNYRRGKILVSWTGKYRDAGTVIHITFNDFYHNDNHVEGFKNISNGGKNTAGLTYFTIQIEGKITNPDGKFHTWNSNRTRTRIEGESTKLNVLDDVYDVSGSNTGINRKGLSYTATITKNLRVELGCEWRITSGIIEITPADKPKRTVDFGNGACDKLVTVTINGKSKTFERRK